LYHTKGGRCNEIWTLKPKVVKREVKGVREQNKGHHHDQGVPPEGLPHSFFFWWEKGKRLLFFLDGLGLFLPVTPASLSNFACHVERSVWLFQRNRGRLAPQAGTV
jgi:hypothetical protein